MTANNKQWSKTINMKLLLQTDISTMSTKFQKKAKKAMEKHFEATVLGNSDDEDATESDDDVIY